MSRPEIGLRDKLEQMEQKEERKKEVVGEYLRGGVTYRELGRRRGVSAATIHRWVKEDKEGKGPPGGWSMGKAAERRALEARDGKISVDVGRLQKELEEARLYNKLLNAMIDIAEEQFEIPIRKKHGARQR